MLAMKPQMVVTLADLRYVAVACPICRTKVVLDMESPSDFSQKQGFFTPRVCPSCQNRYDSAIVNGLDALQRCYLTLAEQPGTVSFHGEMEGAI